MKGIILSGGKGTRLYPLTKITSKQLLPVYDRQMIWYPLNTLVKAGVKEILLIVTEEYKTQYETIFGDGKAFNISIQYAIQNEPRGLAEAFIIAKSFIGNDTVALILGDNIFEDDFREAAETFTSGARIFAKEVLDPERFGVVEINEAREVLSIEEKPVLPKSNLAITGLYMYDHRVVDFAKKLTPSARGELEITDLHKAYLREHALDVRFVSGIWEDAGTFDSLLRAGEIAREKLSKGLVI